MDSVTDPGARRVAAERVLVLLAMCILLVPIHVGAEHPSRRIAASASISYHMLDAGYFEIKDGIGPSIAFRYELDWDLFFEHAIGGFRSTGGGVPINNLYCRFGMSAVFPYFIPYRPLARLGLGFVSSNPLTVTPTRTYRPTQTSFYVIAGAGISRSFRENFYVEARGDIWLSPYRYRIYTFDRYRVTTRDEQFTHFFISLGVSYNF